MSDSARPAERRSLPTLGDDRLVLILAVISVVIILFFWAILPPSMAVNQSSDYQSSYEPVARQILAGNGPVTTDGTPATSYPPGHPFLLAGLFGLAHLSGISEPVVLSLFALACLAGSTVLVFLIARIIWKPLPAMMAALAWATYPLALWASKQPNPELPFTPVLYGAALIILGGVLRQRPTLTWRAAILAGIVIGFAMLIRPIAIGAGLMLALVIWFAAHATPARYRLLLITALLAGNLLMVLPWQIWVYAKTDRIIPLSSIGVSGIRDGLTFAVNAKGYRTGVSIPDQVRGLSMAFRERLAEMQTLGGLTSVVIEEARARPVAAAQLVAIKAARSWYGTDSNSLETPIALVQLLYLTLIGAGTWRLWSAGGVPRQATTGIWLLALYFWVMTMLVLSIARYTLPIMGLLFILIPGVLPHLNSTLSIR